MHNFLTASPTAAAAAAGTCSLPLGRRGTSHCDPIRKNTAPACCTSAAAHTLVLVYRHIDTPGQCILPFQLTAASRSRCNSAAAEVAIFGTATSAAAAAVPQRKPRRLGSAREHRRGILPLRGWAASRAEFLPDTASP